MKILCVCSRGVIKSVGFGWILKQKGYEVLSMGWGHSSPDTRKMLFDWSDRIVLVDEYINFEDTPEWKAKGVRIDVPSGVYQSPLDSELLGLAQEKLKELGFFGVKR